MEVPDLGMGSEAMEAELGALWIGSLMRSALNVSRAEVGS